MNEVSVLSSSMRGLRDFLCLFIPSLACVSRDPSTATEPTGNEQALAHIARATNRRVRSGR